jgi:hypothetical protein
MHSGFNFEVLFKKLTIKFQFEKFRKSSSSSSESTAAESYGAIHLLRLLAKVNDLLNDEFAAEMTPREIEGFEIELKFFFKFLIYNKSILFGVSHYTATELLN